MYKLIRFKFIFFMLLLFLSNFMLEYFMISWKNTSFLLLFLGKDWKKKNHELLHMIYHLFRSLNNQTCLVHLFFPIQTDHLMPYWSLFLQKVVFLKTCTLSIRISSKILVSTICTKMLLLSMRGWNRWIWNKPLAKLTQSLLLQYPEWCLHIIFE